MRYLNIILSIVAIFLSIIAICVSLPATEISFDYLGLLTGILGVIVTVLIGWNIYAVIDFRQEKQRLVQYFDEQKNDIRLLGSDLRTSFLSQLNNEALMEKNIADIYSQMMGLNKSVPLTFNYLFHIVGAIRTASQAENYTACNLWLKEIRQVLVSPELVSVPSFGKKQMLQELLLIKNTEQIVGLNEVIDLVMHLKEMTEPIL